MRQRKGHYIDIKKIYSYHKVIHDRCKIKWGSESPASLNSFGVMTFRPVGSWTSGIFQKRGVVLYGDIASFSARVEMLVFDQHA